MVKEGEVKMVIKLKKSDFNAGSPYSSWLKERIIGEIANHENGMDDSGLIKKHSVELFDGIESTIMNYVEKFDDYPAEIKNMAVEIIQKELDETFEI